MQPAKPHRIGFSIAAGLLQILLWLYTAFITNMPFNDIEGWLRLTILIASLWAIVLSTLLFARVHWAWSASFALASGLMVSVAAFVWFHRQRYAHLTDPLPMFAPWGVLCSILMALLWGAKRACCNSA